MPEASPGPATASGLHERLHDFRVELRAGAPPQLAHGVAGVQRRTIGARAGHGVERVGDVDDAREQRGFARRSGRGDSPGRRAARDAARRWGGARARNGTVRRMRAPSAGCSLISSNSSGVSAVGFRSTLSLMPILPMSCSSAPSRSTSSCSAGSRICRADRDRDGADALRMAGRVGIPRVERQRQRADGADVGALRLRLGGRHARHHRVERVGSARRLRGSSRSRGSAVSKLRDCVISDSDRDSVSIGRDSVRAVQRLARPAMPNAAERQPEHRAQRAAQRRREAPSIESSV